MSYRSWFKAHGNKHKAIVSKLISKGYSKEQIIEYFDFENMLIAEPEFCYLYSTSTKCHDVEKLNCYLCACPLFRFNEKGVASDSGVKSYSYCEVDSKLGEQGVYGDAIHQDCTNCPVPHSSKYVSKNFDLNWFEVMKYCDLEEQDE